MGKLLIIVRRGNRENERAEGEKAEEVTSSGPTPWSTSSLRRAASADVVVVACGQEVGGTCCVRRSTTNVVSTTTTTTTTTTAGTTCAGRRTTAGSPTCYDIVEVVARSSRCRGAPTTSGSASFSRNHSANRLGENAREEERRSRRECEARTTFEEPVAAGESTGTIGCDRLSIGVKRIPRFEEVDESGGGGGRIRRTGPRYLFDFTRGPLSRALLLVLLAMTVLHVPTTLGVPASTRAVRSVADEEWSDRGGGRLGGDLEDGFEDELDDGELEIIRRSIVQGLGLQRVPDPSKANVSQAEYERAHREYLKKVELSSYHLGHEPRERRQLHTFYATEHPGNRSRRGVLDYSDDEEEEEVEEEEEEVGMNRRHRHSLFFPVEISDEDASVDHASLRFLLEGHHRDEDAEVLVYLSAEDGARRKLIARERVRVEDPRDSRWIELDSTEAASSWLEQGHANLGLEVEFLHSGMAQPRILSFPALNVFTASSEGTGGRRKRAAPEQLMSLHKGRRTECRGDNKKCCRHEMTVIFKDLKGFEFIVQPKTFDAGYCKGRCPPRYNPAHHHALLQSLIWKEDRRKAPRPCCAPSKLAELEILYFDENDSTRLKVSNWKNMRVLECACS